MIIGSVVSLLFITPATIQGGVVGFLVTAGFMGIVLSLVFLSLYRSRVLLTPRRVGSRGMFGGIRWVPRSMVAVAVQGLLSMGRESPHNVFLLDAQGRRVLRLMDSVYDRTALDRLVWELRVPVQTFPPGTTANKLARVYPGIVPWAERRPFMMAFAILGGVIILVVVIVGLLQAERLAS
ncbi:hypothetical protein UA75_19010 [Actinoalloteichus sp. GBA129-24]|uniref:Uncharacterized protein n=2 Tax=Pseudonocardiaceae TaxID=2070 RepID=A0AAC9LDN9_9PSEU|nr:hypothetical protein UA74_18520 [Actinoalloteichus fjordicus]APU21792.1 hypothetical protein UA75_19010 [Actinoalloteichus sp. GBA129-24]